MKILKRILILACLLSILHLHAEERGETFKRDFFKAIATSDEALFSLVEFHKLPPKFFNEALKNELIDMRSRTITEIEIKDAMENDVIDFVYDDVAYTSTLPITKNLVLNFEPVTVTVGAESSAVVSSTFMLGVKDGYYRIVAIRPKK
jgi:hypothetical protein